MAGTQTYYDSSMTTQDLVSGMGTIDINYQPITHRNNAPLDMAGAAGLSSTQLAELNAATASNTAQDTLLATKMNKTTGTIIGDKVLLSSGTTGLETTESTVTKTLLEGFDTRITETSKTSNYTINRPNSTSNVVPTSTEIPTPKDGTTATVILNNNLIEFYTYKTGTWVLNKALPPVTLDGNNTVVVRANSTAGVAPAAIEKPTPINGDTADVYLDNGVREVYAHNGTAWALIKTIAPTALDGNDKHIVRANATINIAPTTTEVPTPSNGDTAKVSLNDGKLEYWSYNGTAWVRDFTTPASVTITDNTIGTATVNLGTGQIQDVVRPINELSAAIPTNGTKFATAIGTQHNSLDFLVNYSMTGAVAQIPSSSALNYYIDSADGSYNANPILPVPQYNGQRLMFKNNATLAATLAITNSNLTTTLAIPTGGTFTAISVNGKWVREDNTASTVANDFWRSGAGATTQPDGTTDITEFIRRNGNVGINTDPTSTLHNNGSLANAIVVDATATALTLDATHRTIELRAASNGKPINLPAANTCSGREYTIAAYVLASDTFTATITAPSASILLTGTQGAQTSLTLTPTGLRRVSMISNGTSWLVTDTDYGNDETVIITKNIDLRVAATVPLFTARANSLAIIKDIILVPQTSTGVTTPATVSVGTSVVDNVYLSRQLTGFDQAIECYQFGGTSSTKTMVAGGTVCNLTVGTISTATAHTVTAYTFVKYV